MNKRGFTLIEVLICIILLAALALIVIPNVLEITEKKEEEVLGTRKTIIYSEIKMYMNQNKNNYPLDPGNIYCFKFSDLENKGIIDVSLDSINKEHYVRVALDNNAKYIYSVEKNCIENRK